MKIDDFLDDLKPMNYALFMTGVTIVVFTLTMIFIGWVTKVLC